ncbi:phasin family protein [Aliikangiella marina]|uniref:Phasin family protein n=1 Tax=Aliikangiella marina TaxID=1712262 RepID=A0A545TH90_9GAMM|nr:phasin family protein [Aliikangiella marina]TQV76597.1 phasin family protein [Aliikangiella marina]
MASLKDVEKLGRQAWLAGLGAYGSGWKYAVDKFDETYAKTGEMLNELITEGEKIEQDIQEKLKAKEILDEKIVALKDKLGLNEPDEAEKLQEIDAKVDKLTTAVNALVEARLAEQAPAKKAPAKKAPAKKAAAKS